MAPPGRRPRPAAVSLLHGEKRPSRVNYNAPQAPAGVGPAPEDLTPGARAVWDEYARLLDEARITTVLDRFALVLLCDAIADYRTLRKKPNAAMFAGGAWKRVLKLATEFGLTPSSRGRLVVQGNPNADAFQAFVGTKPGR